jgi:hypothetical protein
LAVELGVWRSKAMWRATPAALGGNLSERHALTVDGQGVGVVKRLPTEIETVACRVVHQLPTHGVKDAGTAASRVLERTTDGIGPEMRQRLHLVGCVLRFETAPGAGSALFGHVPISQASAP